MVSSGAIAGKTYSQLASYQKQFYWSCLDTDGCLTLLKDKQYTAYRACSLNCIEKSSIYTIEQVWCKDSDNGVNFLTKGIVTTNVDLKGKADYCTTFSGKEYLIEGTCSKNNQYGFSQKSCKEIGGKYSCLDGACVSLNSAPVLNPIGDKEVKEGETLKVTVSGTDSDGDKLIFEGKDLPTGATFENGELSFSPEYSFVTHPETSKSIEASVRAFDGTAYSEWSVVKIKVVDVNQKPFLSPIDDITISQGEELTLEIEAADADEDMLSYSVQNAPAGAKLEGNIFTWTPTYEQAGEYEVTVKVGDGGEEDSVAVKIVVVNVCDAWEKTFGGSGNDWIKSIQQTKDEGYILTGGTTSKGVGIFDIWVLKLDSTGNLLWEKTFGGSEEDRGKSIWQTDDGGYIVVGDTASKGAGGNDAWVFKLDSNGNLVWDKTFGGSGSDEPYSIQQTTDGGFIVTGTTSSKGAGYEDAWVFKLDSAGNLVWDKTFGEYLDDGAESIQQTTDGGYIVTGWTNSKGTGQHDAWVFKLDSAGNLVWDKTFGGSLDDWAHSIQQTTDGGYVVAGQTIPKGTGEYDAWILKLNSNGNLEWDKTVGGSNQPDRANSIQQTINGGYIAAGQTNSKGTGGSDAWVLKLDENGNLVWDKTFGLWPEDYALSIQQTSDDGYIVAGQTYSKGAGGSDAWILKLDSDGELECE